MATNRRIKFDSLLKAILGSNNVYFQPLENLKMEYPCIVYNIASHDVEYADDDLYQLRHKYTVRYIALPKDYDGPMKEKIAKELKVPMTQVYSSNGLYHCVFEKIF